MIPSGKEEIQIKEKRNKSSDGGNTGAPALQEFCRGTWQPGNAPAKLQRLSVRRCFDKNQELEGVSLMSVRKALVQDINNRNSTRQKAKI